MMGRVSSVMMLLVTIFVPIGQMIFGVLYDIMDPSIVIFFAGLILMVAVILHKSKLNQVNITEQPKLNKGVEVVGS